MSETIEDRFNALQENKYAAIREKALQERNDALGNTPSPLARQIPQQLIDAGARFIRVNKPSLTIRNNKGALPGKDAFDPAWQNHTYKHDDKILVNWLAEGGNYGVISHAGIGTIDIDELDIFKSLGLEIPDTFSDCREGCRYHVYFKCDNVPDAYKATKVSKGINWGDIRFPGHDSYVVGTTCVAPNKANPPELHQYVLSNPSEVKTLDWSVLEAILIKSIDDEENDTEITLTDGEKQKKPYVMKDGVKKNHYTIISYVGKEMATGVPIPAIHASLKTMNEGGYFDRKRTPDELVKEVDDAIDFCVRKQASKKQDKERVKEEKHLLLPGGIITPEMKRIFDNHHPNVALAHCLTMLIGIDAEDGGVIRWNKDQESWFCWTGTHWQKDTDGLFIISYAEKFLYTAMEDAAKSGNKSFIAQLLHAQSAGNIKSSMMFLKGMVAVGDDVFDTNPALFNVQNGTIDLVTGTLQPFCKKDYITRISNANFNKDAPAVKWEAHMKLVIPDDETRKAFQLYMGYSLLGGNAENTALFLHGSGKNGKSETVASIAYIFGTYGMNSQPQSFYERMNDDGPRPDIARMKGSRFIGVPEGRQGKPLDEGLIKQLTGGDVVTARYLYGREFDFIPTGKLVFFTNHLPKISGRDVGIWRRIYPIPFKAEIPKEDRKKDYHKILVDEESSGILNWMLSGLKAYQENKGLLVPKEILDAKASYKAKEDVLADFMSSYHITGNSADKIKRGDLYAAYLLNAGGDTTTKAYSKTKFNNLMAERIGDCVKCSDAWYWVGIRGITPEDVPQTTVDDF